MTKNEVIEAFKCCTYINEYGETYGLCHKCPMREENDSICAEGNCNYMIDIPLSLAENVLKILRGKWND